MLPKMNQHDKTGCRQQAILSYITIMLFFYNNSRKNDTSFYTGEQSGNMKYGFRKCLFPTAWLFHVGEFIHSTDKWYMFTFYIQGTIQSTMNT